jgi:sugar O-acyltransferase (sialic acid O-acetyltransferase NeuD family)
MKKLVIFGAAFFGYIKLIDAINRVRDTWDLLGFLDDTPEKQKKKFFGYPVLGGRELIPHLVSDNVHFANNVSGHWTRRKTVAELLVENGCQCPNLIHPAIDLNYVQMGQGCAVLEGSTLGMNVRLGNFVDIRYGCVVSHDVVLEDYVFLSTGAKLTGFTRAGKGCWVGAGATVLGEKAFLGEGCVIGAGAVVVKPVPPQVTVVGNPARLLEKKPLSS